jgi:uncharacterized membrane protein YtjA (UPF0391 family)
LVAALFGIIGIAAASADIARILFYILLVIFMVLLIFAAGGDARVARAGAVHLLELAMPLPSKHPGLAANFTKLE